MTAAGIALIAGGIATLICFRAVLFRTGKRRAGRAERAGRPVEAARPAKAERAPKAVRSPRAEREAGRQSAEFEQVEVGMPLGAEIAGLAPTGRRGRRRGRDLAESPVGVGVGQVAEELPETGDDYPLGGLASLGLADREDYEDEISADVFAEAEAELPIGAEVELEPAAAPVIAFEEIHEPVELEAEIGELSAAREFEVAGAYDEVDELELIDERDEQAEIDELAGIAAVAEEPAGSDRYGHRVDGWVRPEYRDFPDEPPAGEYWTPIPVDLVRDHEPSAKGYGWPLPVERLPAVPSYEPATGFDLEPVRSEPTEAIAAWPRRSDERRIRLPRSWDARNETQHFSAVQNEQQPKRRPRPRPRPEPPADRNTTVYVSRHAAEPPR
jgi:hypothetical protein